MSAHEDLSPERPATPHERRRAVATAARLWRRAGVRAGDRRRLLAELAAEIDGAAADGAPLSSVLGHHRRQTLQEWAHAREVTGRSLHAAWLVPIGLLAFTAGTATLLVLLITTLGLPDGYFPVITAVWLSSAVLGVALPALACWGGLLAGGDPRAGSTARWLVLTLPIGEVCAFFLAFGLFEVLDTTDAAQLTGPVVLAVMALALLLGRRLAVRRPPRQTPPTPERHPAGSVGGMGQLGAA